MYCSMVSERNSNIELLRILAAIAVFVVHYNYNIAFRIEGLGGKFRYSPFCR